MAESKRRHSSWLGSWNHFPHKSGRNYSNLSPFSSIYLEIYWKGLYKSLHSEGWGQLEREVVKMRMSLCGFRALVILKATLCFTAEKLHFKLEGKIIAFFKSMCCPSSRIQRIFKHHCNPLREKWKWRYLISLNKCLASFAVLHIVPWQPCTR